MAKKKATQKKKMFVLFGNGTELPIIREDGKYWYTATSQFRKGAFTVIERGMPVKLEAEGEKEKDGE